MSLVNDDMSKCQSSRRNMTSESRSDVDEGKGEIYHVSVNDRFITSRRSIALTL